MSSPTGTEPTIDSNSESPPSTSSSSSTQSTTVVSAPTVTPGISTRSSNVPLLGPLQPPSRPRKQTTQQPQAIMVNGATSKSKPKLQKFSGVKSKIKITSWLSLFEVVAVGQEITEDKGKAVLLMEYLEDEALQFFADEIAANIATITWVSVSDKLTKRFGEHTIDPVLAASRRHWKRGQETVQEYYEDKMYLLRKTGLSDASMAEVLTDGMPFAFRNNLISATITTPSEWLSKAVRLESSFSTNPRSDHTKPVAAMASDGHRRDKPKSKRQPPGPCKYCKAIGRTDQQANHWQSDCKNKPQQKESTNGQTNKDGLTGDHEALSGVSLN